MSEPRCRPAFSRLERQARRADAVPDGRLPGPRDVARRRPRRRRRGRRRPRARRAVLRPARRRAGHPRRGAPRRCATASGWTTCSASASRSPTRLPVVLMVYANPILARGVEQFARSAADAGAAGMIVPDLPHDEAGELRAACDAAGHRARAAGRADVDRRAARRGRPRRARLRLHGRADRHDRRARRAAARARAHRRARPRADRAAGGRRLRHLDARAGRARWGSSPTA